MFKLLRLYRLFVFFLQVFQFWKTITDDKGPYLRRWMILKTPWWSLYIHQIFRSDSDRDCHDHPWDFWSLILWGSYREYNLQTIAPEHPGEPFRFIEEIRTYKTGSVIRHKAEDAHRLELPAGKTTWTLVVVGPKFRQWGFWKDKQWIDHKTYLDARYGEGKWDDV